MPQASGFEFDSDFSDADKAAARAIAEIDKLALKASKRRTIYKRVFERMTPDIRRELDLAYQASGLAVAGDFKARGTDHPGALYEAAVLDSIIAPYASGMGFSVRFPPNLSPRVYARGGIYQFGGVIGMGKTSRASKKSKVRLMSEAGYADKHLGAGIRTVAARGFFSLDGGAVTRLAQRFAVLFNEEFARG